MLSQSRVTESVSAAERLVQDIRQFGSQASPVTIEDILSIQPDTTALPGDQAYAAQTRQPSSGLVNRVHKCQSTARSLPQPGSECIVQDVDQRSTQSFAFTTDLDTPRRSLLTRVFSRLDCRKAWKNMRTCYVLIFFGLLTIIGSLLPALWRSIHSHDVSGGFNLAQYTLAVGVFVIGCVVAIHSRKCTCWSNPQDHWKGRVPGDDNSTGLRSIGPSATEIIRSFEPEV